ENRVAALQGDRIRALDHAVVRAQNQIRNADIEPAVQLCLATAHRGQPTERNGEAAQRFPLQVVVELAVVVTMQARAIAAAGLARAAGDPVVAAACDRGDAPSRRGAAE